MKDGNDGYIGKQIGSYSILEQLTTIGGFGSVYLGKHIVFTEKPIVAVKLLHAHLASKKEQERFLQEARFLEKLKHPNILPIIDAGIQDGLPFLITEYAANGSLKEHLQHLSPNPLSSKQAATILSQIGLALQYAHQHSVVHRDLKPDNILFNAKGEALLADFGIATVLDAARTKTIDSIGTPPYMAPEQFEGIVSMKSDQYALGCIAYELVTGRRPFILPPGANWIAWGMKHSKELPLPPGQLNPQLPVHVEQAILKALATQRDDRHASVLDFITALTRPRQSANSQTFSSPFQPFREQKSEEPGVNTPDNGQSGNHTSLSGSFEQLWREALQAQARGDSDLAFRLLRKITTLPGLASSQKVAVIKQIRSLRQMIPLCLQQAQEAVYQGHWRDEIQAWENLLALEPLEQEVDGQLTLHPKGSMVGDIQERLRITRQNELSAWMYTQAQQFIREQNSTAARLQLEALWKDAPYYGDPADLAQLVGLPPASNYEQVLADEKARQQKVREKVEQERQRQERKEAERQKERKQGEMILGAIVAVGGGAVAGAFLTLGGLASASGAAKSAVTAPVVSVIEKSASALTLLAGFPELIWGAILGALVGLIAVVVLATLLPRLEDGRTAGAIVVVAIGAFVGAVSGPIMAAQMIGVSFSEGVWGIVFVIIGFIIGAICGGRALEMIEKIVG